jgi:hypothetical protein
MAISLLLASRVGVLSQLAWLLLRRAYFRIAEWGGRRVVCQVGTVWTLPWTWDALCRLGPGLVAVMATTVLRTACRR